jgi:hypothetical protein
MTPDPIPDEESHLELMRLDELDDGELQPDDEEVDADADAPDE